MGIMRMGYAHVRVTDMTEAKNHYASTMGLYETLEDTSPEGNKRVFYKGWDEWDHHSVVLEEGGVGVVKYGWKVEHEADIDDVEAKAKTFGLTVERMSKGDNPEIGDGIRFVTPSEHVFEVYHQATAIGTELGTHNPEVFPRHLVGIGAPALDVALQPYALTATPVPALSEAIGTVAGPVTKVTRAPRSPSIIPACGPARARVRSTTVTPSRGPAELIGTSPRSGLCAPTYAEPRRTPPSLLAKFAASWWSSPARTPPVVEPPSGGRAARER